MFSPIKSVVMPPLRFRVTINEFFFGAFGFPKFSSSSPVIESLA